MFELLDFRITVEEIAFELEMKAMELEAIKAMEQIVNELEEKNPDFHHVISV